MLMMQQPLWQQQNRVKHKMRGCGEKPALLNSRGEGATLAAAMQS